MGSKTRPFEMIPLDAELLRDLPEDGAMMGLVPIGATVKRLKDKSKYEGLGSDTLASRLRLMHSEGFVVSVASLPLSAGLGWQRTLKGQAALDSFDAK